MIAGADCEVISKFCFKILKSNIVCFASAGRRDTTSFVSDVEEQRWMGHPPIEL